MTTSIKRLLYQSKSSIIILVIFAFFIYQDLQPYDEVITLTISPPIICMFAFMYGISFIGQDYNSQWLTMAKALPIKRSMVPAGYYLVPFGIFVLGGLFFSGLYGLLSAMDKTVTNPLTMFGFSAGVFMLLLALFIPLSLRFGEGFTRLVPFFIFAISFGLPLLFKAFSSLINEARVSKIVHFFKGILYGNVSPISLLIFIGSMLGLFIISHQVSTAILQRHDY